MTPLELKQAAALSRCRFSPGSTEKRFVQWANENTSRTLTPKAAAFLDRLAHSYRKQLGCCMAKECACAPKPAKVHRQGWTANHMRREPEATLCGSVGHTAIVNDDTFPILPDEYRCRRCDSAKPTVALHYTRLHAAELRVAFELLFMAIARVGEDLANLKRDRAWDHRHYHRCWHSGDSTLIEGCACGAISLLDVVTWSVAIAGWHPLCDGRDRVREEDSEIGVDAEGVATWGTWCRRCLRVVGEFHKPECPQPRITASEQRLVDRCSLSSDTNIASFVRGVRSPPEISL